MTEGKVFFDVVASIDGFVAPGNGLGPRERLGIQAVAQPTDEAPELGLPAEVLPREPQARGGGETGHDNRMLEEAFRRAGVSIMGKRMFEGENSSGRKTRPFTRQSSS